MSLITMAEKGWLPDFVIRLGIRRLLRRRLAEVRADDRAADHELTARFVEELRHGPALVEAAAANEQHYEVPAEFFQAVLGGRLKYSCGLWTDEDTTLDESEENMLAVCCRRAELEDGMEVLDLGCGWGSLSLWIAEKYPNCRILGVSNSHSQREHIEDHCRARGLSNVEVRTTNVTQFATDRRFDRVMSIEMFEHVRNYQWLLSQIASWLKPEGTLFVHIFCHCELAYPFEDAGKADWMARHFFSGGIMPSAGLLSEFDTDMTVRRQWMVDGTHYSRTCEAWLQNLDRHQEQLVSLLSNHTSDAQSRTQLQRWRMFFMACSELFGYGSGSEWGVAHYLLSHSAARSAHAPNMFDHGRSSIVATKTT